MHHLQTLYHVESEKFEDNYEWWGEKYFGDSNCTIFKGTNLTFFTSDKENKSEDC